MRIVVVIPSYNEAENISRLIPQMQDVFASIPHHEFFILVVDGNSPDGTAAIVTKLAETTTNLFLLVEKQKAGLGAAYFAGFRYALDNLNPDALVEMDADLQHSPQDFTKLVAAFDEGYDYVLGSRFSNGINLPKDWELHRKLLSIGGNLFTKVVLGIFTVNDFTTGFKLSRVKSFVDQIDFSKVSSSGFAYKIDLLFKMHKLGAKIKEVPINFGVRDRGDSKMEKDNALDSIKVVVNLRYKASKSFFKFIFVGFAGLLVDSLLFVVLRTTVVSSGTASFMSGLGGMLTTFTLNNYWSFKDRKIMRMSKRVKSFFFYVLSSYIPIIFRSWLILHATSLFGDTHLVAYSFFAFGIVVGTIWNYIIYSRVIWRKKKLI